ncbi:MAG TPA: tyrosine-type recombinase/integrase [Bacteroidia bacterium]|nr:tyrosine-type recombinase/integrase [Bacteroidia bacterium]
MKPLYLKQSQKFKNLHVQCRACNALIDTGICKKTGRSVLAKDGCPSPEKHVFKAVLHVAKTKNGRKTKILQSRDYDEAIKELLAFKASLKEAEAVETTAAIAALNEAHAPPKSEAKQQPMKLFSAMSRYVGYLSGDSTTPAFKRKQRSPSHIADVERSFLRLVTAAKENGREVEALTVEDMNDDELLGEVYEYLVDELELGNSAYNRAITNFVSFYNWLKAEGHTTRNPWEGIVRRQTRKNVETIEPEQFDALCEIMQKPELGVRTLANGVRKNYWRSFLPDAMRLLLFTGKRRTECVLMKWSDAVYKNDILQYIQVPDYKVNRQKNLKEEDWIYHYAPGTEELRDLLKALGEEKYRDSDHYILAPEERMSRTTMASLLSKAFDHYAEQLGLDLTLGSLRRTNFSSLAAAIGLENAQTVSGHAGMEVMKRHYISKKVLIQAATHNVFDRTKARTSELNAHRGEKGEQSIER